MLLDGVTGPSAVQYDVGRVCACTISESAFNPFLADPEETKKIMEQFVNYQVNEQTIEAVTAESGFTLSQIALRLIFISDLLPLPLRQREEVGRYVGPA